MWVVNQDRKYIGKIIHAYKDELIDLDGTIEYNIKVVYGMCDEDEYFLIGGWYKQEVTRDKVFEDLIKCLGDSKAMIFEFPKDYTLGEEIPNVPTPWEPYKVDDSDNTLDSTIENIKEEE